MTITLEMFKTVCMFHQITPQFLHLISDFEKKARSFDEDYMTCYHQFSFNEETKNEILMKESDKGHNLNDNQKARIKSYDWWIFV